MTVIRNATVFDGEGGRIDGGTVIFGDGVIQAIGGAELAGARRSGGNRRPAGKFVTPGMIDVHSHLGDYPSPGRRIAFATAMKRPAPSRPEVWAEHSVWPQDPGFSRALANGGVTDAAGAAGLGQSVRRPLGRRSRMFRREPTQGMKFPGAPYGLKMACGENPKRVYGSKGNMPQTRMGNIAFTRGDLAQGAGLQAQVGQI